MDQGRTVEILKEAKVRGCVTTLDVFAASQEDFTLIEPLLPFTDYFMPSEEEAMALTGLTNFEEVCSLLLEKGAKAVVLTLGADGAMYRDQTGLSFETPAYDLDVICTCGCGDCFNGGFATGLHLGLTPQNCVQMAQASSAQNALGLGSQAVISDLTATKTFMENNPLKC
jgi:sugar/nucleoside kinase (ribokinase family)